MGPNKQNNIDWCQSTNTKYAYAIKKQKQK